MYKIKVHQSTFPFAFVFFPPFQGYGLATYHAATASTTSNIIFANDTTSSFDFVGIDIDDIARLRRSFVSPAASNNL